MKTSIRLLSSFNLTAASLRQDCRKIVCIGRNYADHITELNNTRPTSPFFFLKPTTSLLLPGSTPIQRPRGIVLHHEVELGLVIGQELRDLHPDDETAAMRAIHAYFLAIDLTARNLQDENKRKGLPWAMAKGFDTFCPVSAPFSPERFEGDPYRAHLRLAVDGKVKQSDGARLMLFRIPRILSEISRVMTLEPGDLVLTGTPKGVGPLVGGQRVEVGCTLDSEQGQEIEESKAAWHVVDSKGLYDIAER